MPRYPWLLKRKLDGSRTQLKLETMVKLGVPYSDTDLLNASAMRDKQAKGIAEGLAGAGIEVEPDREIVALIAYLQRMGTDYGKRTKSVATVEGGAQ